MFVFEKQTIGAGGARTSHNRNSRKFILSNVNASSRVVELHVRYMFACAAHGIGLSGRGWSIGSYRVLY